MNSAGSPRVVPDTKQFDKFTIAFANCELEMQRLKTLIETEYNQKLAQVDRIRKVLFDNDK
jgi:hypothetical protein